MILLVVGMVCQGELPGVNKAQLLIESGLANAIASALKAYELRGPAKVDEANQAGLVGAVWALSLIDMTAPEALPIRQLLGGMGSALRFTLDHPLDYIKALAVTSSSYCAVRSIHCRAVDGHSAHSCLLHAARLRNGVRQRRRRRRL